jgi:hypothetical protein
MANISLEGSIRTCKVDTAWANKLESDRFLNPSLMLCPPWKGHDTSGRPVCPDSFYTKTPGCNSASDRVTVENGLRPQYIEYVNLDAAGIRGGQHCGNNQVNPDTVCHQKVVDATHQQTGQFGLQTGFSQNVFPNCMSCQKYPNERAYGHNGQGSNVVEQYMRHKRSQRQQRRR